jgi:DNA end-binding protein Ku
MVTAWKPERYRDDYQADVMAMIDERVKSGQLESAPEAPAPRRAARGAKVVDLMSLLKRSVEEGGRRPARAAGKRRATSRRQSA